MKATQTAIVLAGLCAALFTSCRKSDYMTADNPNATTATTKAGDNGTAYLKFNSGSMAVTEFTIKSGERYLADMGPRVLSLTDPILKSAANMDAGYYDNLVSVLKLDNVNGSFPLQLKGQMNMITPEGVNASVPVEFIMTMPLHATATSGPVMIEGGSTVLNVLNLQLERSEERRVG